MEKLSNSEFYQMIFLLHRYMSADMDQFENWSFDTEYGPVYAELTRVPSGPPSGYDNLNHIAGSSES